MDQNSENNDFVLCEKCGTRNSFGSYECMNCREILNYGNTDEPYIDAAETPGKKPPYRTNWYRKSLFYIPPFILLLFLLTAYLYYGNDILLVTTIVIFLPWASLCAVEIHDEAIRRRNLSRLEEPKDE